MSRPILILGYERSGTTLLRRIISMHPNIPKIGHEKGSVFLNCDNRQEAINKLPNIKFGKKIAYISFKRIELYIEKYRNFFPKSLIIHIIRNPIYVINSQMQTFNKNFDKCLETYFKSVPLLNDYLLKLRNIYIIKYEELINNPFEEVSFLYYIIKQIEIPKDIIKKIISTKESWTLKNKKMCGLKYFDKIAPTNTKLILTKEQIMIIKNKEKTINRLSLNE